MTSINWHSVRTQAIAVIAFVITVLPLLKVLPQLAPYTADIDAVALAMLWVEHKLMGNTDSVQV